MSNQYEYEWDTNSRQQAKCWCFTLNNYTTDECSQLKVVGDSGDVKYLIYGKEKGDEKETPHLQGFIIMRTAKRLKQMTDLLPKRCAKVRPMYKKSNPFACYTYCSKDGDITEYGDRPEPPGKAGRQRQIADYATALQRAKQDQLSELEQEDPGLFLRYHRTLHVIRDTTPRPVENLSGCCGVWIVGPSNTGKSEYVRKRFGKPYEKSNDVWWTEYNGEKVVMMDDLDKNHAWFGTHLKRWADKYPFKAKRHCLPSALIRPEVFVVSSNYEIKELFEGEDKKLIEAIEQRFKVVVMDKVRGPRPHVLDGQDLNPYIDEEDSDLDPDPEDSDEELSLESFLAKELQ